MTLESEAPTLSDVLDRLGDLEPTGAPVLSLYVGALRRYRIAPELAVPPLAPPEGVGA